MGCNYLLTGAGFLPLVLLLMSRFVLFQENNNHDHDHHHFHLLAWFFKEKKRQLSVLKRVMGDKAIERIYETIKSTPWKINMESTNHPFGKEHDLNQTSMRTCSSRSSSSVYFRTGKNTATRFRFNPVKKKESPSTSHLEVFGLNSLPMNIRKSLKM